MESCVLSFLQKKGFTVNTKAAEIINTCDDWYSNRMIKGFHNRRTVQGVEYELSRLNFAKRCCSDDANLCEILEINAGKGEQADEVNSILGQSEFTMTIRSGMGK